MYREWTTTFFVKFIKLSVFIACIHSEQVSVDYTSLSKVFKSQGSYNSYIKVNETQLIKIIDDNTSCILQCASVLEFIFLFFYFG